MANVYMNKMELAQNIRDVSYRDQLKEHVLHLIMYKVLLKIYVWLIKMGKEDNFVNNVRYVKIEQLVIISMLHVKIKVEKDIEVLWLFIYFRVYLFIVETNIIILYKYFLKLFNS